MPLNNLSSVKMAKCTGKGPNGRGGGGGGDWGYLELGPGTPTMG